MEKQQTRDIEVVCQLVAALAGQNRSSSPSTPCIVKKTVAQIVQQQQHYLIALKANQPRLYRSLQQMPERGDCLSQAEPVDTSHKRQVHCQVTVYAAPAALRRHWPGLKHLIRVKRWGQRAGQAFSESMGYITNREGSAEQFLAHIQEHWGIENCLHWVRDVNFASDDFARGAGAEQPTSASLYDPNARFFSP